MPTVYIIGGCNGAGKTTASLTMLPQMLNCKEFVNADSIAAGISPFQPEKAAFEAGRVMLERIRHLMRTKVDFAFETTLSTKSYSGLIHECKDIGYEIVLVYFWLNTPELAIERVKERVLKGGHYIPDVIVKRRYERGLKNLFHIFIAHCDHWFIMDNSGSKSVQVAEGGKGKDEFIFDKIIWNKIKLDNYAK
jgi:predicted ABC-type ATPase